MHVQHLQENRIYGIVSRMPGEGSGHLQPQGANLKVVAREKDLHTTLRVVARLFQTTAGVVLGLARR